VQIHIFGFFGMMLRIHACLGLKNVDEEWRQCQDECMKTDRLKINRPAEVSLKSWLVFGLALLAFPAWMGGMWWSANTRSGWNTLVEQYGEAPAGLAYPHRRAIIGVVRPPNRRHVFADASGGGSYRRGKIDYGFDENGFWMRGRFRGLTYGPARSLYIPWSEARAGNLLTIELIQHPYAFYVQEQRLLDAAAKFGN
jgi:hypothetical protein